jgi:hypothetical protein
MGSAPFNTHIGIRSGCHDRRQVPELPEDLQGTGRVRRPEGDVPGLQDRIHRSRPRRKLGARYERRSAAQSCGGSFIGPGVQAGF